MRSLKNLERSPRHRGGWQSRLNPGSLADQATADALRKLAEGQTTGIIEAGYSFRPSVSASCCAPGGS